MSSTSNKLVISVIFGNALTKSSQSQHFLASNDPLLVYLKNPWVITIIGGLIVLIIVWIWRRVLGKKTDGEITVAGDAVKQEFTEAQTVIGSQTFNYYGNAPLSSETENVSRDANSILKREFDRADEEERLARIRTLLGLIKDDLYSTDDRLPSVLLRALELARMLGKAEEESWIYLELTGYSPGYTKKPVTIDMRKEPYSSAKYRAADGTVRVKHGTPSKVSELLHPQFLSMPVTDIIHRIEETKRLGYREFWISQAVPYEWRREFPSIFRDDEMPVTYGVDQFQHVLDGIRTRILNLITEVERNLAM